MKYVIEVDEALNETLTRNANKRNMSVQAIILQILRRYVLDSHIMEQDELWQSGIKECAEINLDWANL